MKPEKMMDVIGQIDDALVEEFAQRRPPRFRVPWSLVATAACLCLVIASLVFLRSAGLLPVAPMPTDPTQTTQPTTTQPTETTTLTQPTILPTPGDIPTDWIIEEDTSITGKIIFATPFKGAQGMDAMITAFNEIYPNIEVELHTYYTAIDGSVSINTVLLAGEVDVVAGVGVTGNYKRWVNGLLYDLTDLVEQENIDLVEQWGTDAYIYDNYFSNKTITVQLPHLGDTIKVKVILDSSSF